MGRIEGASMVTLNDIAIKTGYTISTVSKALNHSAEISSQTSKIIWNAARDMGYIAKKSTKRTERTIGVILPEVDSQYYTRLMNALNRKIIDSGYKMVTVLTSEYSARISPAVDQLSTYAPDGMIVCCGDSVSDEEYHNILDKQIPAMIINELSTSVPIDSICIEPGRSMRLAIDHLIELGHKKIGYIGEFSSDSRYRRFLEQMDQHDLNVDDRFVKRGSVRFEQGGYELAKELVAEKELPTAIVACYDQVAIGAMKLFLEKGIRIPEDIAILGFDNIIMDEYMPVALTSITNPVENMGATAVRVLIDAIRNPKTHEVQNITLQSRLIIRSSTRPE